MVDELHSFQLSAITGYLDVVKLRGCWVRAGMVMLMLGAAIPPLGHMSWRVVQLVPMALGVGFAWLDARPQALNRTVAKGKGVWHRVGHHFLESRQVAAVNISGVLEGLGAASGALLFAGPFPVHTVPAFRLAAVFALTIFAWNAYSQVVTDAGYQNLANPPRPWTVAVRWLLPPWAATFCYLSFIGPTAPPPIPLPVAAVLAGSFLILWPYMWTVDLLLRCSSTAASDAIAQALWYQRRDSSEWIHRAKNVIRARQGLRAQRLGTLVAGTGELELSAYSFALFALEDARQDTLALSDRSSVDPRPVSILWKSYLRTLPDGTSRERLRLIDDTNGQELSVQASNVLQHALVDLCSNALRATTTGIVVVKVDFHRDSLPESIIRITVEDDGNGGVPSQLDESSSLAILQAMCRYWRGDLYVGPKSGGGTVATATFTDLASKPVASVLPRKGQL